jgi:micrococcal nuclease
VIKVIDGDTVKLANGRLLRYIGIDTPESRIKKGNTFVYGPQPYADEATQTNRNLVEGKVVRIEFDVEKEDRYGRLLGYCFIKDTFVNAQLLKEGLAVLYTYPPNVKYVDTLVSAQKLGRQNKQNLWAESAFENNTQSAGPNALITVEGEVIGVNKGKNYSTLLVSSRLAKKEKIRIYNDALTNFNSQGIPALSYYSNKLIRASGRQRGSADQYYIIIHDPSEIEILDQP